MGDENDLVEVELAGQRLDDVGLLEQRVGLVGLGRQPVAEHVEQHHPLLGSERVEDVAPVEGAAREAMEDEQRRPALAHRRLVDHEDPVAEQLVVRAPRLPFLDRTHGRAI